MIEARAESLDARGEPNGNSPQQWTSPQSTPEGPEMVEVSREQQERQGQDYRQTHWQEPPAPGFQRLFSKGLLIKAKRDGKAMQVDIVQ